MRNSGQILRVISSAAALMGITALLVGTGGCARRPDAVPSYTATATATINPELPPTQARPEANQRAEIQARDQIMAQAAQTRLPDGRTLEDVAVTDTVVRAHLFDTVRSAHVTEKAATAEGVFTITLSLEKDAVQRIVNDYVSRGGK